MKIVSSYEVPDGELNTVMQRYQTELQEKDNRIFFLGFNEKEFPCAYVQLILKNADNDIQLADGHEIAHIHDLRVRCELQGHGYGKTLMRYLENEAKLRRI